MSYVIRVILVVVFALPGALLVLSIGVTTFAFAGDGGPFTGFEVLCWFLWAGVGGACLGASPGLLLGLVLRVKWVLPFLGAAAGCLLVFTGVTRPSAFPFPGPTVSVPMAAGCVVFGSFVGSVVLWFWPGNSLRATPGTPTDTASPIQSAATLYIRRESEIRGPFERVAIRGLFTAKKLKKSDEVASTSDGPWELLGDVYKTLLKSP